MITEYGSIVERPCEEWLEEYLRENGTTLCEVVRGEATKLGYKKRDLKAARRKIGVQLYQQMDIDGPTGNYFWYL